MIHTLQDTVVRARVNSHCKEQATRILKKRGWSMSGFLRVMINTIAETGEIPTIPNAETIEAIRAARRGELKPAGKTRAEISSALWD